MSPPAAIAPNAVTLSNVGRQTLGVRLRCLPRDEFRIAVPELLSDADQAILPWGFPSPHFEIADDRAQLCIDLPKVVRMEATVQVCEGSIEIRVKATNLSAYRWERLNAFTCFACHHAPSFDNPLADRTKFLIGTRWQSVARLRSIGGQDRTPFTFCPVRGAPRPNRLWVCRQLRGRVLRAAANPSACVISADGKWAAHITSRSAGYLFSNRQLTCVHACPLLGDLAPGESGEGVNVIRVLPGAAENPA